MAEQAREDRRVLGQPFANDRPHRHPQQGATCSADRRRRVRDRRAVGHGVSEQAHGVQEGAERRDVAPLPPVGEDAGERPDGDRHHHLDSHQQADGGAAEVKGGSRPQRQKEVDQLVRPVGEGGGHEGVPLPLLGCLREWLLVFGHVYPDDLRTPFGFLRTVYGVSTRGKYGVLVHEFPEKAQERALRALWSPPTRPARGPQRGLTVEAIVTAAIDLVEAEGLAALSMRQVAARLGVGTATLYTYLPGKAELTALMLDAVTGDGPLPHEWPGDWRAKLTSWARDDWEAYRRHPWILELSSAGVAPGPTSCAGWTRRCGHWTAPG